jgi:hypothetical protein
LTSKVLAKVFSPLLRAWPFHLLREALCALALLDPKMLPSSSRPSFSIIFPTPTRLADVVLRAIVKG